MDIPVTVTSVSQDVTVVGSWASDNDLTTEDADLV